MNPSQTTQTTQNSSTGTSPFTQIQECEKQEKERTDKELNALQEENAEVSQSIAKKEVQATEDLKSKAKTELKEYSAAELTVILSDAKKEADEEVERIKSHAEKQESAAVDELVNIAKDPEKLLNHA